MGITRKSRVELVVARKSFLLQHKPRCGSCRTNTDITITDSIKQPARWWCARCKHEFAREPEGAPT